MWSLSTLSQVGRYLIYEDAVQLTELQNRRSQRDLYFTSIIPHSIFELKRIDIEGDRPTDRMYQLDRPVTPWNLYFAFFVAISATIDSYTAFSLSGDAVPVWACATTDAATGRQLTQRQHQY